MLVLAIDTSSAAVTAAIVEVERTEMRLRAECVTINARGHGKLLAPSIQRCLGEIDASAGELGAIVAGLGPGPFTGLRVGLVTAAVMGEALGIPTYGICSLDSLADAARDEAGLLVATDARRKEVYWARYEHGLRRGHAAVSYPSEVPLDGVTAVTGQGVELYDFALPTRAERYPVALSLVRCAAGPIRAEAESEPLIPLYLRRPDAVPSVAAKKVTPKKVTQ